MSLNVILLLILTAIFWGITPAMEKKGLESTSPIVGLVFRNFTVSFFLILIVLFMGKTKEVLATPPKTMILFAATGIIAGLLAMFTYWGALKLGATSKIVPIAATYPLITAVISIVALGEHLTALRFAGITLIVGGVWLVGVK